MSTALVTTRADVIPFTDLQKMAAAIAESGLFGMKDTKQALALMLTAQAEGQHPATITQDYDIIQGKACRKTHSVLARFQQAGGKVDWHDLNEKRALATFSHPSGGALQIEWNLGMAERAGLTGKDNWRRYPRAMLRARCIAEGVRAVYPAAIGGYLVPEEAQDLDTVPGEVTSRVVVEMPRQRAEPQPESAPPASVANVEANAATPDAAATGAAGSDAKSEGLTEGAKNTLKRAMERAGRTEADLIAAGFEKIDALPFARFNEVMKFLRENPAA